MHNQEGWIILSGLQNIFWLNGHRRKMKTLILILFLIPAFSLIAQNQTCGVQWDATHQLSNDSALATNPLIVVTGDTIHTLWYGVDTLGSIYDDGIQYSHSFDSGKTFSSQKMLLSMDSAFAPGYIAASEGFVYVVALAAIDTFYGTVLLRSSDAGNSWQPYRYLLKGKDPEGIVARDSLVIVYYGTSGRTPFGFLVSTNHGSTWRQGTTTLYHLSSLYLAGTLLNAVGEVAGDIGRGVTEVGYFTAPLDGTALFGPDIISADDNIPSILPTIAVNQFGDLFAAWADTGALVFRESRNGGYSWIASQVLSVRKNAIFSNIATDSEFVSVAWDNDFGSGGAIYLRTSNDYGKTYCPIDSPTTGSEVGEPKIVITGRTLRMVWSEQSNGHQEIFYRDGTLTKNPGIIIPPPTEFVLAQNYPNPFNGSTQLRYDIPVTSHVRLTVYNILGQQVAQLVDAVQSADHYTVAFEGTNLPSGVYFYRLKTANFTAIKKLMIIR